MWDKTFLPTLQKIWFFLSKFWIDKHIKRWDIKIDFIIIWNTPNNYFYLFILNKSNILLTKHKVFPLTFSKQAHIYIHIFHCAYVFVCVSVCMCIYYIVYTHTQIYYNKCVYLYVWMDGCDLGGEQIRRLPKAHSITI